MKGRLKRHSKSIKSSILILGAIAIVLVSWLLVTTLASKVLEKDKSEAVWSVEYIEDYLSVNIPENARNIEINGKRGYGAYFDLTFETDPENSMRFSSQICSGNLHQSYNPFNAVDVGFSYSYTHKIVMDGFQYYSYSPDTPETLFGNRCWAPGIGIHQILVDQTDSNLYRLRLQLTTTCDLLAPPLPCWVIDIQSINPITALPITVIGMKEEFSGFILISDEICIDMSVSLDGQWSYLIGSEIQFSVDNHLKPIAYINEQMRIIPLSNNDNDDFPSEGMFTYCLMETWSRGLHTMTINVILGSGEEYEYSWEFGVE